MKIIAVDDEPILLGRLEELIHSCIQGAQVASFGSYAAACEYVDKNETDIAFLDIQIGKETGVDLAKYIKTKSPLCNIVFCTGYDEYMHDAFDIGASDYLIKPLNEQKIRHAVENLRNKPSFVPPTDKLYVRCFGEFEVYCNGAPLLSLSERGKELFAYLIDREGAVCTSNSIIDAVFSDSTDSNFRKTKHLLEVSLAEAGFDSVLVHEWGKLGIRTDAVVCDYYEYLKKNPAAVNLYNGVYMPKYEWAKNTARRLAGK